MYEFILWVIFGVFTVVSIPFFAVMLMKEKEREEMGVNLGRRK